MKKGVDQMTAKNRKKFSYEVKRKAVEDYISGVKTAEQIAIELQTSPQAIYNWKTAFTEENKGIRIEELIVEGNSEASIKRIMQMEDEIAEYQKKVAEQALIIDLLKKLRAQGNLPPESELNGLIEMVKKSVPKRKRVK